MCWRNAPPDSTTLRASCAAHLTAFRASYAARLAALHPPRASGRRRGSGGSSRLCLCIIRYRQHRGWHAKSQRRSCQSQKGKCFSTRHHFVDILTHLQPLCSYRYAQRLFRRSKRAADIDQSQQMKMLLEYLMRCSKNRRLCPSSEIQGIGVNPPKR